MKYLLLILITFSLPAISYKVAGQTITGSLGICDSHITTLTGSPAGGTWVSGNPSVASISSSGVVAGVLSGTSIITYTAPSSATVTAIVTVYPNPSSITGPSVICAGSSAILSSTSTGGTWASANTTVGAIDMTSGSLTGVTAGTTVITYTLGTGCYTVNQITVNPLPAAITGPATICTGTGNMYNSTTGGGIWISGNTSVATVSSGVGSTNTVTGIAAGTAVISYITASGCSTSATVSVSPIPTAGIIYGPSIVCIGMPVTLSSSVSGGVWSSASATASISGAGVVTGFVTGPAIITYAVSSPCGTATTTAAITVSVPPSAITGTNVICNGATTTLANTIPGGTWYTSSTAIATAGPGTGLITGIGAGIASITYSLATGCSVYSTVTINPTPPAIGGISPVCIGHVIALSDALAGGTWSSSNPAVATIATLGASTGVVTGVAPGTAAITYGMSTGCQATGVVTVNGIPVITASATPASCGGTWLATALGGSTYSWEPVTGVACPTCASTTIDPAVTTTYTVSSTGVVGCDNTAYITVNGNRIYGHINFSTVAPASLGMMVWLIKFNATDSSLVATDSIVSCLDGSTPYYQFDNPAPGSYLVKAKLLSSIAGSSDYIPTYGASTANWTTAASITHTEASDSMAINMIYGTVPAGAGFISGNVYSGAGKGTSGDIPAANMLVFLKDFTTGQVLTYTYTNADGAYTFSDIAYGNYLVHPEDFSYYTTESDEITLNETTPGRNSVNFKEFSTSGVILPIMLGVNTAIAQNRVPQLYPNPSAGEVNIVWNGQWSADAVFNITDITGRIVFNSNVNTATKQEKEHIVLAQLADGMYFYTIHSATANYSGKLQIQKH